MRATQYKIFTMKTLKLFNTKDNYINTFMIKSGLIRKISSGIYSWLPNGVKIINNIKQIIKLSMNEIGAMEIQLPLLQPSKIWYKSKRIYNYGQELIKIFDRHKKKFILSPTNEEIIAFLIEKENLYKNNLPIILYQINNKFRDEKRPKFGIMRCKEFIMKDAYSFHINKKSLKQTYELIIKSYKNIFNKINLKYFIAQADNGCIGGSLSHEFHVITNIGENKIVISDNLHYIANLEIAKKKNILMKPNLNKIYEYKNKKKFLKILTINEKTLINIFVKNIYFLKKLLKTIFIKINKNKKFFFIAVIMKYNQKINLKKISEHLNYQNINITKANNKEIKEVLNINCQKQFYGPFKINISSIIIDENIVKMKNFILGANINNKYFINLNWGRDLLLSKKNIGDLCDIEKGDLCPNNKYKLNIKNSMEIAHIFQLGNKYLYKNKFLLMGCYGIGINRLIIAIIEQNINKKKNSIIWPIKISPFKILILPINMYNSQLVNNYAKKLYFELIKNNIEVFLYDIKASPGEMFYDMELIGIPYVIILSEKKLTNDIVEYKNRQNNLSIFLSSKNMIKFIKSLIIFF